MCLGDSLSFFLFPLSFSFSFCFAFPCLSFSFPFQVSFTIESKDGTQTIRRDVVSNGNTIDTQQSSKKHYMTGHLPDKEREVGEFKVFLDLWQ